MLENFKKFVINCFQSTSYGKNILRKSIISDLQDAYILGIIDKEFLDLKINQVIIQKNKKKLQKTLEWIQYMNSIESEYFNLMFLRRLRIMDLTLKNLIKRVVSSLQDAFNDQKISKETYRFFLSNIGAFNKIDLEESLNRLESLNAGTFKEKKFESSLQRLVDINNPYKNQNIKII